MRQSLFLFILFVIMAFAGCSERNDAPMMETEKPANDSTGKCPMIRIDAERLPDLNVPRNAHTMFCVNGEVTVVGGHTTNFVPTATAEYYKNGEWVLMEAVYPHDNGVCVVMNSGKVLLAGGHAEPLGVGQTFPVEEYDPTTHTFRGFSCLDTKRTLAGGVELDSGRIIVAGNWYHNDGIEIFDGDRTFSHVKDVTIGRASPYILRIAHDDALILGNGGLQGDMLLNDVVDRLKGEPFHVPLLQWWQPLFYEAPFCSDVGFIGDEKTDDYSWLLPVQDWSMGDSTQWLFSRPLSFVLVRDTTFTLLPTTCPAPIESPYGKITYYSPVIADREAQRGYVHGMDQDNRHYLLCVEYDKTPAPLTLYYTDPLPDAGFPEIVLTDDGDLMIAGGINYNKGLNGSLDNDNFSPLASVFLFRIGNRNTESAKGKTMGAWFWALLSAIIFLISLYFMKAHKSSCSHSQEDTRDSNDKNIEASISERSSPFHSSSEPVESLENNSLMLRICNLMEQQKLYLNSDLKLADLAATLGSNRNIVSACINSQRGCTFSQFVCDYRISHAQEMMKNQPDIKISEVWMGSGFSTESSFFRAFKASTGMTPTEWKAKIN